MRLARERFYRGIARDMARLIERDRNETPQQRQARAEAVLARAEAEFPRPEPRKRVSEPLYDPQTGITWAI